MAHSKRYISCHDYRMYDACIIGVKKKLKALAKQKDCDIVGEWSKSIINHLYWCAMTYNDGNQEMIQDKWLSLINHIHNKHRHSGLFKKCAHPRICRRVRKKWFKSRKYMFVLSFELQNINFYFQKLNLVSKSLTYYLIHDYAIRLRNCPLHTKLHPLKHFTALSYNSHPN